MLSRTPFRRSAAELGRGVAAASARQEKRLYVLISGMAALLSCAIWPLSRLTLCDASATSSISPAEKAGCVSELHSIASAYLDANFSVTGARVSPLLHLERPSPEPTAPSHASATPQGTHHR